PGLRGRRRGTWRETHDLVRGRSGLWVPIFGRGAHGSGRFERHGWSRRRGHFGLLGLFGCLARPIEWLAARSAEVCVVLVLVPALRADDHSAITSTVAGTGAGLAAATHVSTPATATAARSRTVNRGRGSPGSGLSGMTDQETPPLSTISGRSPAKSATWSASPCAVPRRR